MEYTRKKKKKERRIADRELAIGQDRSSREKYSTETHRNRIEKEKTPIAGARERERG